MRMLQKLCIFTFLQISIIVWTISFRYDCISLHYQKLCHQIGTETNNSTHHHKSSSHVRKEIGKVHVLIVSSWRSGSSLLGELFSINPNVFYLMEPGWHVWTNFPQNNADSLQLAMHELVRSVFLCDISAFNSYLSHEKRQSQDLFGWQHSRALCTRPACDAFNKTDIVSEKECIKACGRYPLKKVEDTCQIYSHIVQKEVRFLSLVPIFNLLRDPSLNIRIIHLVRDPRAVFNSRFKASGALVADDKIIYNNIMMSHSKWKIMDKKYRLMEEICKVQVNIYRMAIQEEERVIKGRYKMVRFEDLTKNVLKVMKDLYKFANLSLMPNLQDWMYNITHGTDDGSKMGSFQVSSRDSLAVSEAWKKQLPNYSIRKIQTLCQEALNVFGYDFHKI
ncbi:carbohydrate sulfotransferase 5-like [Protopterus annectens]|uniref:carbohydrate sulfotransferase 5-like n=1 Tax=Protopterus annectens TaxID=7888 RepID=UPI001CFA5551|nr:carbohydrate sulfotransferase 5-like [Protopterus annectens]XP_043937160.1 carbohydrate sulfotransferase 5-like [Protopterus annectens]